MQGPARPENPDPTTRRAALDPDVTRAGKAPTTVLLVAGVAALCTCACRRIEDGRPASQQIPTKTMERPSDLEVVQPTTMVVPDFARVAQVLGPSVVTVVATVPRPGGRKSKALRGLGSGVVVKHKYILTNEHVVASATRVDVELSNGTRIPAEVAVAEPLVDLALLELQDGLDSLEPITWADEDPSPGQWVMAMGQPFGLGHTVTVGVVSGLGRDHDDLGRPAGLDPDGFWSFIQTDASINIGNSGGPLVDASGHVVGITTAVRNDGQGLAFAIPSTMAQRFVEEAIEHGRVRLARLGIKAENEANPQVTGRASAVRVTEVEDGSPGARAGLQPGDLLLSIDGTDVTRVSEVAYLTQLQGVGAQLDVTIARNGEQTQVLLVPGEAT